MEGTFSVFVSFDGCLDEKSQFTGTYEQCVSYIRTHRPPKGCDFDIQSHQTGRLVSWVL